MTGYALGIVGEQQSEGVLAILNTVVVSAVCWITIVIVAGAASRAIRDETPVTCLRRIVIIFFVAGCAIANVLCPYKIRPVVFSTAITDNLVVRPGRVNIVYQCLSVV